MLMAGLSRNLPLALCLCLVAWLIGTASAAATDAPSVRDEAQLFSAETRAKLQIALVDCQQKSGVGIHIVTFGSLGDDLDNRTQRLLDELAADEPAIILAFGWGMQAPMMKVSSPLGERYPVAEHSTLLVNCMQPFANPELTLSERFDATVSNLSQGYAKLEASRLARESQHFPTELFLSLAAVVVGAALVMWIVILWLGKSSARHEEYYFPKVEVAQRLGAPFGGGLIVHTNSARRPDR